MLDNQRTIGETVACCGIGLHSGHPITMTIFPAPANTGIVFHRIDVKDKPNHIRAHYTCVSNTRLCTTLTNEDGVSISTVEHIMAALWGAGIDNAIIEIDGAEVPIMDGSSEPFMSMLESASTIELTAKRRGIVITKPIEVVDGNSRISVLPAEQFGIEVDIEFQNKTIAKQCYVFDAQPSFRHDIARARTFGFMEEVEQLTAAGLARGGSLENVIVVDNDRILNKEGLRYPDEFVRHKVLDSIGDFYLAGVYIKGHFQASRPGHAINNKMLHKIFADKSAWQPY